MSKPVYGDPKKDRRGRQLVRMLQSFDRKYIDNLDMKTVRDLAFEAGLVMLEANRSVAIRIRQSRGGKVKWHVKTLGNSNG